MEPDKAFEALASGDILKVLALVIVVQAIVIVVFWRKINALQDCRINESIKAKTEVTELMVNSNRMFDSVNVSLREVVRMAEKLK